LFATCLEEPQHVLPCMQKISDRKRKATTFSATGTPFAKQYGTIGRLIEKEPDWIIEYIESVSDLTTADLLGALNKCGESLHRLMLLDTQLQATTKLATDLQVREVLWRFFGIHSRKFGSRLANLKANGMYDHFTMTFDWAKINYVLEHDDKNILAKVTHRPTGISVDVRKFAITTEYLLRFPCSDLGAQLVKEPLAPTKIATKLFAKRVGPNLADAPGKAGAVQANIQLAITEWQESISKSSVGASKNVKEGVAKKQMMVKNKEDNTIKMDLLRKKASESMKNKLMRETIPVAKGKAKP
jgi:hypothetical protein